MPSYTAIVTVLAVMFYFFLATRVATARSKFGVKTSGDHGHKRLPGFFVQSSASLLLLIGAIAGLVIGS
jgi:hypothetical protein